MTTRTVEVEVTATEEEEVHICDHCGLEATDENSVTFAPISNAEAFGDIFDEDSLSKMYRAGRRVQRMAMVTFDAEHESIHYHEDCLPEATISDEHEAVAWNDYEANNPERRIELAWTGFGVSMAGLGVLTLVGGAYFKSIWLGGLGLFLVTMLVRNGVMAAREPDEWLKGRVE